MNEMPRGWITFPRGGGFAAIQVPWVSGSLCQARVKASEVFKTSRGWWLHEAEEDLGCKELSDPESFGTLSPGFLPTVLPGRQTLDSPASHRGAPVIPHQPAVQQL